MTPRNLMIVLYVEDMAAAVAFYRDGLGLAVADQSAGWSRLACGDASVGLHAIYRGVDERPFAHAGLNLEVDDLEAAIAQARAHGATLLAVREPDRPGLPRLAVLRAPDGNGFELRQLA
jgi:catechol 2,3-dioxygenase-like lactoylglutathione lyase family enzyme